jgi:OmpA-OmpF porin, OOP family
MEAPILEIAGMLGVEPDLSAGTSATVTDILNEVRRLQRNLERAELSVQERDERVASLERMLGGATQERLALSSLLSEQQQRRERLERAENLFSYDEAEVLRTGNSLILRLIGLNFDTGSARIESGHEALLDRALEAIELFPHAVITVEGHTDSIGNPATNLTLSERRANAVRDWLLQRGDLEEDRIGAAGYGENFPVASNESPSGRARNRRIDLVISGIE